MSAVCLLQTGCIYESYHIMQCISSETGTGSSTLNFYTMYLFSRQPGAIAKTERQLQPLKNPAQRKDTHSAWAVGGFLVSQHQTSSAHFTGAVTCTWALVLRQGKCSTPPQLDKVFPLMKAVVRWELSGMSAGGRMKSHNTVSLASNFPHLP